uniref:Uncharacterized protein n=1 Tax=Davidia involucrata TaxID=16924 RepID=A0A5B6ZJB2_DAVIN
MVVATSRGSIASAEPSSEWRLIASPLVSVPGPQPLPTQPTANPPNPLSTDTGSIILSTSSGVAFSGPNLIPEITASNPQHTTNAFAIQGENNMVEMNGFRIHHDEVGLARRIISKYPDIGASCQFIGHGIRSMVFKSLLNAIHILEGKTLQALSSDEIQNARNFLIDAKVGGLNVEWLLARIEEITEARDRVQVIAHWETIQEQVQDLRARLAEAEEQLQQVELQVGDLDLLADVEEDRDLLAEFL